MSWFRTSEGQLRRSRNFLTFEYASKSIKNAFHGKLLRAVLYEFPCRQIIIVLGRYCPRPRSQSGCPRPLTSHISLIFAVLLCTRLNLCLRRLPRDWIKFKIRPYPLRTCEKFKNDVISNLDILRNSSVQPKSPPFSHLTVSQQIRNRVSDSNLNLNRGQPILKWSVQIKNINSKVNFRLVTSIRG